MVTAVQAQDTFYWPAQAPTTASTRMLSLPMGTPVMLETRTQISTKDNRPGTRIYLRVAENVMYGNQIVIPAGAPAVGEVTQSDQNGHWGKKGKLAINLLYVQTPSGPVQIGGEAYKNGKSGAALSITTFALVSVLGLFIHGTSAVIPHGTPVQAYLAQPVIFAVQQTAQAMVPGAMATPGQVAALIPGGL
jgi:hypothetical protein